jgi:hypothetical protein
MNWTSYNPVSYAGRTYGQKDMEFAHFLELPCKVAPAALEIAVRGTKRRGIPDSLLRHKGWRVVDPLEVCPDLNSYRRYLESSKAEWSVAKNGYVAGSSGWFSCRSACYLAAGRPVIVQDTGFGAAIPTGEGVLTFKTLEEAANAIHEVEASYDRHAKAARAIAAEYFDSDKVLTRLIDEAMSCDSRTPSREVSL